MMTKNTNHSITAEKIEYYIPLIHVMPMAAYLKDHAGFYVSCNEFYAKQIGITNLHEVEGLTVFDIFNDEKARQVEAQESHAILHQQPQLIRDCTILDDGQIQILISQTIPLYVNNTFLGILGFSFSSEHTCLEKDYQYVSVALSEIIDLIPGHVYWKDKHGKYIGCNDRQAKSLGYSSNQDLIGKSDFEISPKKIAEKIRKNDLKIMNKLSTEQLEEKVINANGTESTMISHKIPLKSISGDILGVLGISFDMTGKTQLLQAYHDKNKAESTTKKMQLISASLAHELRTPMANISMTAASLSHYFPILLNAYKMAKTNHLNVENISSQKTNNLATVINKLGKESKSVSTFLELLLASLRSGHVSQNTFHSEQISSIIKESLGDYPFENNQLSLVQVNLKEDFICFTNKSLLKHVFFNLLRNALWYIASEQKGQITITTLCEDNENIIIFEDTAAGIPPDQLSSVFEDYSTYRKGGTGIGLSFCKMVLESMQAKIACKSTYGSFTRFIISFPKMRSLDDK